MYSGDELYGDDVTSGRAEGEKWPERHPKSLGACLPGITDGGEPVKALCPNCQGELGLDERVSRTIGMKLIRRPAPAGTSGPAAELLYEPDTDREDETFWETSETIGLVCLSCARTWPLGPAQGIEELIVSLAVEIIVIADDGEDADPDDERPCGCPIDYHLADCPIRTGPADVDDVADYDRPERDDDESEDE
jgi:hypothetical protein